MSPAAAAPSICPSHTNYKRLDDLVASTIRSAITHKNQKLIRLLGGWMCDLLLQLAGECKTIEISLVSYVRFLHPAGRELRNPTGRSAAALARETISCCCSEQAQCSGTRGPSLAKPTWMGSVRVLFNPLHAREEPKFMHRNYAVKKRRLRELRALKRTRSKYSATLAPAGPTTREGSRPT
jgi:hypothetical protein